MSAQLTVVKRKPGYSKWLRVLMYSFLTALALAWLVPVGGALYASFRPYQETQTKGIFSWPDSLTVSNYSDAFTQGDMKKTFLNTAFIVLPAIVLILLMSSFMAFAVSRFSFRFNIALLLLFTAGNLLPAQVLFQPLFQMFKAMPWPDVLSDTDTGSLLGTKLAVIIVHVAFQTGFCTFVLSNYMKTLPKEIYESAMVDGASVLRQYWQLTLPLCRPPLAALATLQVTWIYNEFFWATVLMQTGDKFPITSSLNNLRGQFFTDVNLVAAGSLIVALPPLIVFFILQKQFVSGLTLGATKG